MREDLVTTLNPMQRSAVELGAVHSLILAGAGSGKTKVLTTRIAWLLANGMAYPSQILAVTFTNKAAREMRTRLEAMLPVDLSRLWMGTFHGIAHKLLRLHAQEAGLPATFQIIDSSDQLSLVKRIMKEAGVDPELREPKSVQAMINRFKEKGLRSSAITVADTDNTGQSLYQIYEARCQKEGLVDFAELLLRSLELLENNAILREHYAERFRYILVDEFQDTNVLQYRWIQALSNPKKQQARVFCVGDDDQSIYAFRGACVGNMAEFVKDYKVENVIRLEQNYRSTSHILDAANAVIAHNTDRMGKNLWTDSGAGDPIQIYYAADDRDEARSITQDVMVQRRNGVRYSDCAVLYRNNSQSRIIESYFTANGIPYRIYGGLRFFDRAEVKDVTAYLRVMTSPDDTSVLRVINHPPRGIGATTVQRATEQAAAEGKSLWEVIAEAKANSSLQRATVFVELIERMKKECAGMNLADTVKAVIDLSGLKAHYELQRDRDIRLENINEVVSAAQGYCDENDLDADAPAFDVVPGGEMSPAAGFLSQAVLEADDKNDGAEARDEVQMMTVHASKGLEFEQVYLTGLEQGLFPHGVRPDEDAQKSLSEERRLMYVAMTRARKRLRISCCAVRMLYGRTAANEPSQFLEEIPAEHTHELNERASADADSSDRYGRGGSRYGSGYGGGYSKSCGSGGSSGYGSRSGLGSGSYSATSYRSDYKRPPTGVGAKKLDSDAWKSAGVRRASDFAPRATESGLGSIRAKKEAANAYGLSVGDKIEHKIFGVGVVEAIRYPEKPDQTLLKVKFASGSKELLAHIVREVIRKVG